MQLLKENSALLVTGECDERVLFFPHAPSHEEKKLKLAARLSHEDVYLPSLGRSLSCFSCPWLQNGFYKEPSLALATLCDLVGLNKTVKLIQLP